MLRFGFLLLPTLVVYPVYGQRLLPASEGYPARLIAGDMAVLENASERSDMNCKLEVYKPILGFDLRYHVAYVMNIPAEEAIPNSDLQVLFRVTPRNDAGAEPVYFAQSIRLGEIPQESKASLVFEGMFDTGVGDYRIDWMMRDRMTRICAKSWEVKAPPVPGELLLAQGAIAPYAADLFTSESPLAKPEKPELPRVHVLLHFAPPKQGATTFQPFEKAALLSILRVIARDPRIGRMDLTVFNLEQQKVLYRDRSGGIDFPALGQAVDTNDHGSISVEALAKGKSPGQFLTGLMKECRRDSPGAPLIFIGPQAWSTDDSDTLREAAGDLGRPQLVYLSYNPNPSTNPFSDVFDQTVRLFKGRRFGLQQPKDFLKALPQLFSQRPAEAMSLR